MVLKEIIHLPKHIHYLLRLFLFWLLMFALFRIVFLVFNVSVILKTSLMVTGRSLVAGFRLDLSTIAYLMSFSFLLWVVHQFLKYRIVNVINNIYILLLLFFISILAVSNIKMYHEWGALLNIGVFDYLAKPKVVAAFITNAQLFLLVFFVMIYFAFSVFLYKKIVASFPSTPGNKHVTTTLILLFPFLLPVMARGGLQLAPINESSAYYSDISFYNHVAINPVWYFIHSYLDRKPAENPYMFMEESVAEARIQNLFFKSETRTECVLTTTKPNVIIIVLESWTADIIRSLGGENNITPNFDSLRKEGLLFTQIYAPGSRTEHGLVSILSGYPPPPQISIITIPSKAEKIKNMNEVLLEDGDNSSFYYGGEIGFVNMKSYLINSHFKSIIDKERFETNQLNPKWGAHDQYVYEKQLHDLKNATEPFFSVLLTLSSHEPFEVPMQTPFTGNKEPDKFRSAAFYSDHCLGEYFRAARKEKWFDNTLFILVADHGHRLPRKTDFNRPASKKIPLLFYGNVLKESVRGTTINKVGNQHDIAATLLGQLNKDYSAFPMSKDMLNPVTKEFAYYTNNNVLGWITPGQKFIYIYASKEVRNTDNISSKVSASDSVVLDAKAYLQLHYQQYLDF